MTFQPIHLLQIELSQPLPTLPAKGRSHQAQILLRLHQQPLGVIEVDLADEPLPPTGYEELICATIQPRLQTYLAEIGQPMVSHLGELQHLPPPTPTERDLPLISVVICTRDRTADLKKCLPSLLNLDYPRYEIVLVDNAPSTPETAEYIYTLQAPRLRYVLEKQPGLSAARNTGLRYAIGEIVAFTDDDALADPNWLRALAAHFVSNPTVACVTGRTMPAELETEAQLLFEQFGGFNKGRGFDPITFSLKTHYKKEPLFPYLAAKFGAGVNMAYRTRVLRDLGGFDPALGVGTLTGGAEDIDVYFRIIMAGHTLIYEPGALVFHYHRRDYAGLKKQLGNNGTAFGAFVMKCLLDNPLRLFSLLMQVPFALFYLFNPRSERNVHKQEAYPAELTQNEVKGMLRGPLCYLQSRAQVSRKKLEASSNL